MSSQYHGTSWYTHVDMTALDGSKCLKHHVLDPPDPVLTHDPGSGIPMWHSHIGVILTVVPTVYT